MGKTLRVSLTGENAELGRVAAADVGRLLLGVERSVANGAASVLRRRLRTGRRPTVVEAAVRFRLVSIERGSVVGVLELPDLETQEGALELDDQRLGELALERTLDVLEGRERDPEVAASLAQLADEVGVGTRYDAVRVERTDLNRVSLLDPSARSRLAEEARSAPEQREERLVGTLVEADFEKHTARLRTMVGGRVVVSFGEDLADDIQRALREQASFEGRITFDPQTSEAVSVTLESVVRVSQLPLGHGSEVFWSNPTVEDLLAEQGVRPVIRLEELWDEEATEEEVEAFLSALGE